jgi:NO-binding membrane sensor protein with MHYT domain
MGSRMRVALSYSNVIATLALVIALGGTSYAAVTLGKNSVRSRNIANGAVSRGRLRMVL